MGSGGSALKEEEWPRKVGGVGEGWVSWVGRGFVAPLPDRLLPPLFTVTLYRTKERLLGVCVDQT